VERKKYRKLETVNEPIMKYEIWKTLNRLRAGALSKKFSKMEKRR